MNILVLSPCSRRKQYDPALDCVAVDTRRRADLVEQFPERVSRAAEMYTGDEHQHVSAAVSELREIATVDWDIISAGFGHIHETTPVPAYDCGFSDLESVRARAERFAYNVEELTNAETIQAVAREKRIPQDVRETLTFEYDLLFVVLSEPYLCSVTDALTEIPDQTTAFAIASKGSKHLIGDCTWIPATETERQALGTTWMELRGEQFWKIASAIDPQALQRLLDNPD